VKGTHSLVSLCEDGEVVVWNVPTRQVKRKWRGSSQLVALSDDGLLLASGSLSDGKIDVFKTASGEKLSTIEYTSKNADAITPREQPLRAAN
jgi:WD40 repeat protein